MKMIELTRVPFGAFFVNPEAVGAVTPAVTDPFEGTYNQHVYGCCVLIQGQEYRVQESALMVLGLLGRGQDLFEPEPYQAPESVAPVDPLPSMEAPKKGKKRK